MVRLTIDQARRMALAAQGMSRPRPEGRIDVRHFRRVLRDLGAVQLDSVNVVVRAHYLPFFTRLGPYDRTRLDDYLRTPEVMEYWGHAASVMPVENYHLFRHRMRGIRPRGRSERLLREQPGYVEAVYRHVARRGPVSVSDLPDGGARTGPWWGYSRGKIALEWLFARGRVGVNRTNGFVRLYDLPRRLYPESALRLPAASRREAYEELLVMAARRLGVGTAEDLADYFWLRLPETRPLLERLAQRGRLRHVEVAGSTLYAYPEATLPRRIVGCRLLSPFDSLVWYRPRLERLFEFWYRIEIYVPAARRTHGYYVLPVLLDGEFAARVDLKAHRDRSKLEVRGAYVEDGRSPTGTADQLAPELRNLAAWLGLERITVARRGSLAEALRQAM